MLNDTATRPVDWNLIRTFASVVDAGSLAAAARRLGLAHPTVARHVQQLETAIGMPLFDRRSSGLQLNSAGRELAACAANMTRHAHAFTHTSEAIKKSDGGVVRITASEFLGEVFPTLLQPLLQGDDGRRSINVDLMIDDRQLNLLEDAADIAIRHAAPQQQDLVCRRLAPLPYHLYASADYLSDYGQPQLTDPHHWFIDYLRAPRLQQGAERMGFFHRRRSHCLPLGQRRQPDRRGSRRMGHRGLADAYGAADRTGARATRGGRDRNRYVARWTSCRTRHRLSQERFRPGG